PAAGGTSVIITNFSGIKAHEDATFEITLSGTTGTCTKVTFFVNANSGNAYPGGDEFDKTRTDLLTTSVNCDGILKCPSLPASQPGVYNYSEISGANSTQIAGYENKDGSVCVAVPFAVSFSGTNRSVTVFWDPSQPAAAVQSNTTWPPELVQSD